MSFAEHETPSLPGKLVRVEQAGSDNPEQITPEKLPPPWFKNLVQTVLDAWFDPKSFEEQPEFYEKFGIRTFKKYIPTGDLVYQLIWKKVGAPDIIRQGNISNLSSAELFTRILESVHLVYFALMSIQIGKSLASGDINNVVFVSSLNILVNVYPIMLQRYNRTRLFRAMYALKRRRKS